MGPHHRAKGDFREIVFESVNTPFFTGSKQHDRLACARCRNQFGPWPFGGSCAPYRNLGLSPAEGKRCPLGNSKPRARCITRCSDPGEAGATSVRASWESQLAAFDLMLTRVDEMTQGLDEGAG